MLSDQYHADILENHPVQDLTRPCASQFQWNMLTVDELTVTLMGRHLSAGVRIQWQRGSGLGLPWGTWGCRGEGVVIEGGLGGGG